MCLLQMTRVSCHLEGSYSMEITLKPGVGAQKWHGVASTQVGDRVMILNYHLGNQRYNFKKIFHHQGQLELSTKIKNNSFISKASRKSQRTESRAAGKAGPARFPQCRGGWGRGQPMEEVRLLGHIHTVHPVTHKWQCTLWLQMPRLHWIQTENTHVFEGSYDFLTHREDLLSLTLSRCFCTSC